jgi:serine/threonine protein phosphatase PrpC
MMTRENKNFEVLALSEWELDSKPDQEGADKPSFQPKNFEQRGEVSDACLLGQGFVCRKGLKQQGHEHPNQDAWLILKVKGQFTIYGVFDGHGKCGHDVSDYVKENLPKLLLMDPRFKTNLKEVLREAFFKMQAMLMTATDNQTVDASRSGTTATVMVHDESNQKLTVAHVGDSAACLAQIRRQGQQKDLVACELTKDHKPEDKQERARIEKAGGKVEFDGNSKYRVYAKDQPYPGLNMTRCLGDLIGHKEAGLSCVPQVSEQKLTSDDLMILLCSDGIWEFVTPLEAVGMFREALPGLALFQGAKRLQHWSRAAPPGVMGSSEKLARFAYDKWIEEAGTSDDITVLAALLRPSAAIPKTSGTSDAPSSAKPAPPSVTNNASENFPSLVQPMPPVEEKARSPLKVSI